MSVASITTLRDVFMMCQCKPKAFEKGLEVARDLYSKTPHEEFLKDFIRLLQIIFPNTESSEYALRLLDFAAQFVAAPTALQASDAGKDLHDPILRKVLEWSESGKTVVRERCCLFVQKLLKYVTDDSSIDDELFDDLERSMLMRLRDKVGRVRSRAVGALARLQDPTNDKCKIVKEFLFHLEADTCVDVRAAIVTQMIPSTRTLGLLVERTRDIKDSVRKLAFERIAEKVPVKYLKIKQRTQLLDGGLNDPSSGVRQVVTEKLIPTWLKHCQDSVADLIKLLDVHGSENVVYILLKTMLTKHGISMLIKDIKQHLLDQNKLIGEGKLSCETALYWRMLAQILQDQGSSESESCMDEIFPDLIVYCGFVSNYVLSFSTEWEALRQLDHHAVSQHLILLMLSANLADSAGRECVRGTIRKLLLSPKVSSLQIPHLMKVIRHVHPKPGDTLLEIESLLLKIQASLSQTEKEAQNIDLLVAKMEMLNIPERETEQDFNKTILTKQNVAELEGNQSKIMELTPESDETACERNETIIIKCLTLVAETIIMTPLTSLTHFLLTCHQRIILPGIVRTDTACRKQAVRALSACCVLSKDVATQNLQLLFEIALADQPNIQSIALAGAFDVLLVHGLDTFDAMIWAVFEGDSEENPILHKASSDLLIDFLIKCTDMEDESVKAVAVEGLAKLQLYGHICSSTLLSALILRWINPDADKDSRFHQVLGAFMKAYSEGGPRNTQCFEKAFMPTLEAVLTGQRRNPLTSPDPCDVVNFLVEVTLLRSPGNPLEYAHDGELREPAPHDRLAEQLCQAVLQDPDSSDSLYFLKALTLLRLTQSCAVSDLMSAAQKMEAKVKARRPAALVKQFKKKLVALSPASREPDEVSSSRMAIRSVTSSVRATPSPKKRRALARRIPLQGSDATKPVKEGISE